MWQGTRLWARKGWTSSVSIPVPSGLQDWCGYGSSQQAVWDSCAGCPLWLEAACVWPCVAVSTWSSLSVCLGTRTGVLSVCRIVHDQSRLFSVWRVESHVASQTARVHGVNTGWIELNTGNSLITHKGGEERSRERKSRLKTITVNWKLYEFTFLVTSLPLWFLFKQLCVSEDPAA